jgi:hypothetical protein
MDIQILFSFILSSFLYVLLHAILLRRATSDHILETLAKSFLLGFAFPLLFAVFFSMSSSHFVYHLIFLGSIGAILYVLFVAFYILGPFGLIESSLRLHMLAQIAQAGHKGMPKDILKKKYNIHVIIHKRLARFLASGDFVYENGTYSIKNTFSFFLIQAFFFIGIQKIYGNKKKDTQA